MRRPRQGSLLLIACFRATTSEIAPLPLCEQGAIRRLAGIDAPSTPSGYLPHLRGVHLAPWISGSVALRLGRRFDTKSKMGETGMASPALRAPSPNGRTQFGEGMLAATLAKLCRSAAKAHLERGWG